MITRYQLDLINKTMAEAERIAKQEAPMATFVLVGIDPDYVYFNVVARSGQITPFQKRDLVQKTRFIPINIKEDPFYRGEFKIQVIY